MKLIQDFENTDLQGNWNFVYSDKTINVKRVKDIYDSELEVYPAAVPGIFVLVLHANGIFPDPYFGPNI